MSRGGNSGKSGKAKWLALLAVVIIGAGAGLWIAHNLRETDSFFGTIGGQDQPREPIYDPLTGYATDLAHDTRPTFCVQIPNGSTDGARPQVGLDTAAIVFEAIAETGITRFAAIYRNLPIMLGPIRSLRPYYLDWDVPFDCTIVHDGGSDEALAALRQGAYRDLDEDFDYMWKVDYIGGDYRYWNNVFTSRDLLERFSNNSGYTTSDPRVFPRLTPPAVADLLAEHDIVDCADTDSLDASAACTAENATHIAAHAIRISFTGLPDYDVVFQYSTDSHDDGFNTYNRFNGSTSGTLVPHQTFTCADKLQNPPTGCELTQVAPSAVVVMRVQESTMADGYHEQIQTIGSGTAYIFQNGDVIEGRWEKSSRSAQIVFTDQAGEEIAFTPGQLWISAVPQFGSVTWE